MWRKGISLTTKIERQPFDLHGSVDPFLVKRGRRYGVEVKFMDAPRLTPSMRIALSDLRLERLTVLYPGDLRYTLDPRVTVVPLAELAVHSEVITHGGIGVPG